MLPDTTALPAASCKSAPFQFTVRPLAPISPSTALSLGCTVYEKTAQLRPKAAERVGS